MMYKNVKSAGAINPLNVELKSGVRFNLHGQDHMVLRIINAEVDLVEYMVGSDKSVSMKSKLLDEIRADEKFRIIE